MRIVTWGILAALVLLASYPSEGANPRAEKGDSGQNDSFPINRRGSISSTEKDLSPLMDMPILDRLKKQTAGSFEGAEQALEHGDNETALRTFRLLAENGDAVAQFKLGAMYDRGENVPQNFAEAEKWYRAAAEQGHAEAQLALGGYIIHPHALRELKTLYFCERWSAWKSEILRHDKLRAKMKEMKKDLKTIMKKLIKAHKWFNLAASRPGVSKKTRDKAVCMRDFVAEFMDLDQVSLAQNRAREWRPKK